MHACCIFCHSCCRRPWFGGLAFCLPSNLPHCTLLFAAPGPPNDSLVLTTSLCSSSAVWSSLCTHVGTTVLHPVHHLSSGFAFHLLCSGHHCLPVLDSPPTASVTQLSPPSHCLGTAFSPAPPPAPPGGSSAKFSVFSSVPRHSPPGDPTHHCLCCQSLFLSLLHSYSFIPSATVCPGPVDTEVSQDHTPSLPSYCPVFRGRQGLIRPVVLSWAPF